jgi:hypothetical protein
MSDTPSEPKPKRIRWPYEFRWGFVLGMPTGLKGKRCRMLTRGKMNSCLLEFEDGSKVISSRNALKRIIT